MKTVMVIAGASGAIGHEIAEHFGAEYDLFLTRMNTALRYNGEHRAFRLDAVNPRSCAVLAKDVYDIVGNGRVILVNAFGVNVNGMAHTMSSDDFATVVKTNLIGVFNVCSAFLPLMREREWGRVITLSSIVGMNGVAGTSAYSASKSDLLGLTRTLAVENARRGITVNVINLGYMNVGMIDTVPMSIREQILRRIPMRRFGSCDNVNAAIHFLIHADYVTGTSFEIDGGVLCS